MDPRPIGKSLQDPRPMTFKAVERLHKAREAHEPGTWSFDAKHDVMFLPSLAAKRANQHEYEELRNNMGSHTLIKKTGRTWMVKTRNGQFFQTAVDPQRNEYYTGV